jgi:hypothetical protein
MATIAAIIKIILRNIAISPLHVCVDPCPTSRSKGCRVLATRAVRGSSAPLVVSGSISLDRYFWIDPSADFIEPAWREGA